MRAVRLSEAADVASHGGKAAGLARLIACGLDVPEGFVVGREAFDAFLATDGLGARISRIAAGVDPDRLDALEAAAQEVRGLIDRTPLPPDVRALIDEALEALGEGAIGVRSSAVGEDAPRASFAGQLDTVLDVRGAEHAERALKTCWASYWSARAMAYQRRRAAPLRGMAVILQRQVEAAVSGVLFTRPVDPAAPPERMVGEYAYGLGDALVSGRVDPGRFSLDRDGTLLERAPPPQLDPRREAQLTTGHLQALGLTAAKIEEAFGGPQDIEWTVDAEGTLFLLQARPITTLAGPGRSARRVLWSNANINENFPAPVTPLLFSIASEGYSHYFRNLATALGVSGARRAAMEPYLRQVIGAHGGRLYYNLSNIHAILRLAPFGERLAAWFDRFVGAEAEEPAARPPVERPALLEAFEVLRFGATSWRRFAGVEDGLRAFERAADEFAARTQPGRLAGAALPELRDALRTFCDLRFHRWTDAAIADAMAMVSYGMLEQLLRGLYPQAEQTALHNTLLKGLTELASSAPVESLWRLSRSARLDGELRLALETLSPDELVLALRARGRFPAFARELERHLEAHGFRGSGELMLTVPSFQEDPRGVLTLLRGYLALDGPSPAERLDAQARERLAATSELRARSSPLAWVAVARALEWTQRAVTCRERARTKQALLYSRLRRLALAIGAALVERGALEVPDDVFWLDHREVDALLSGGALLPGVGGLIVARRQAHARVCAQQPPDRFVVPEGEAYPGGDAAAPTASGASEPGAVLTGMSACGGSVTARAASLRDLSEAQSLKSGDILVTRQTDPGWAPVFFLIRGLVMERGGMLSHGSILAREFGLPSVVGVKGATDRIATGARLRVDGDRGEVHLLSSAEGPGEA